MYFIFHIVSHIKYTNEFVDAVYFYFILTIVGHIIELHNIVPIVCVIYTSRIVMWKGTTVGFDSGIVTFCLLLYVIFRWLILLSCDFKISISYIVSYLQDNYREELRNLRNLQHATAIK